jgi:hypothetical protein
MQEPSPEAGTSFSGQCGELCGAGHPEVRVVTFGELASGAEDQRAAIGRAGADLAGRLGRREGEDGE